MITAFAIWLACGALGSVIMSAEIHRQLGLKIGIDDFTVGARFALLGPVNLAASMMLLYRNRKDR